MRTLQSLAVVSLGMFAAHATPAQTLNLTCSTETLCDGGNRCTKAASGVSFQLVGTLNALRINAANEGVVLRLKPVGRADDGFFSTFTARLPDQSVMLFSLWSGGFMLTQHGLFEPTSSGGVVATASPSVQTRYGTCIDAGEGGE